MNKQQVDGVIKILRERFPLLHAREIESICREIVLTVLGQATKADFPGWFKEPRV
jgi:hypothetical protein